MTTLREAAQQALGFTMRDFATMRDFQAARSAVQDALRAALEQRAEPAPGWCKHCKQYSIEEPLPAQQAEPKIGLSLDGTKWHGRLDGSAFDEPKQTPCDIAEDGVCEVIDCCRNPAQQAEPVAPYAWMAIGGTIWRHKTSEDDAPLYTAPPPPHRKPLTEEQIRDGRDQLPTEDLCGWSFKAGVAFAERAHGIGGADEQA